MKAYDRLQSALILGRLFRHLSFEDPATARELCEVTGLHEQTMRRYLRNWRAMKTPTGARLVRIAEWKKSRTVFVPCYEFNVDELPDTRRPKAVSSTDRQRASRARRRAAAQMGAM